MSFTFIIIEHNQMTFKRINKSELFSQPTRALHANVASMNRSVDPQLTISTF